MLTKHSRYKNTKPFSEEESEELFPGFTAREIGAAHGVIEHEVQNGDRLDVLARHYYNNDRLWWRIADANPQIMFGPDLLADHMAGEIILIPKIRES